MTKLLLKHDIENLQFSIYQDRPSFDFLELHQVHGPNVVKIDNLNLREQYEADGLIADKSNLSYPLAIKTADCLALLFVGENQIALIHAGWRGVHQNIHLHPLIVKMKPYYCYIAPHITQDSFEVTSEFKDYFKDDLEFFQERNSRLFFSLRGVVEKNLKNTFSQIKIEFSGINTYTQNEFNSFRRDKTQRRNYNIVTIKN